MNMLRLALTTCLLSASLAAFAQPDVTAAATYGSVDLSSGFSPDPHVVDIVVGGEFNAAETSSDCVGYVAASPDFSLQYTEDEYALSILAVAGTDTTLMINDPDGNWHCNDDTGDLDGANPGVYFGSPESGRYDIWVGSYSTDNNYVSAKLVITEQGTENWRTIASSLGNTTPPVVEPPDPLPPEPVLPTEGLIQYGRKTI